MDGIERGDEIGGVNVVADLLAAISVHRVGIAGHRAAHQVGQESVQARPSVIWAGETAAAEANGRHAEVSPVFLDEQVSSRL